MRTARRLFAVGVCLALGLAGLAVGQEKPAPDKTPPKPPPSSSVVGNVTSETEVPLSEMVIYLESPDAKRTMPPAPPAATVSQKGAKFAPRLLVVTVGQGVNFPNDEDRPIEHNVFSNSPSKRFDLGLYGPGTSKSVAFDKPGPVFLYCSIHRYMDGVVFVSPTPYSSLVGEDGKYEIKNVPPGKWIVKTWQRRRRFPEKKVDVTVKSDSPATVDLELKRK